MELTKTSQLDELIGFIGGKVDSRELKRALAVKIEVPITNQKQKQTYYGALNYQTKKFLLLRL